MRGVVIAAVVGSFGGTLLAFGGLIALFDWAHQGPNTRPWQAVVGWVVPIIALLTAVLSLRGTAERVRQRRVFLVSFGLSAVVGFTVLWAKLTNA